MPQGPKLPISPALKGLRDWVTEEPSVMDDWWEGPVRSTAKLLGLDDPNTGLMEPPMLEGANTVLSPVVAGVIDNFGRPIKGLYSRVQKAVEALSPNAAMRPEQVVPKIIKRSSKDEATFRQLPEFAQQHAGQVIHRSDIEEHLKAHPEPNVKIRTRGVPSAREAAELDALDQRILNQHSAAQVGDQAGVQANALNPDELKFYNELADQGKDEYALGSGDRRAKWGSYTLRAGNPRRYQEHVFQLDRTPDTPITPEMFDNLDHFDNDPNIRQYVAESISGDHELSFEGFQDWWRKKHGGDTFSDSHWPESNPILHLRVNDRNLPSRAEQVREAMKNFTAEPDKYGWNIIDNRNPGAYAATEFYSTLEDPEEVIQKYVEEFVKPGTTARMVENIQSKWHSRGADVGYYTPAERKAAEEAAEKAYEEKTAFHDSIRQQYRGLNPDEILHMAPMIQPGMTSDDIVRELKTTDSILGQLGLSGFGFEDSVKRLLDETYPGRDPYEVFNEIAATIRPDYDRYVGTYRDATEAVEKLQERVPDAPFKGHKWVDLGLKHQLLDLAETEGVDALGIMPSQVLHRRGEEVPEQFQDKIVPGRLRAILRGLDPNFELSKETIAQVPPPRPSQGNFSVSPAHEGPEGANDLMIGDEHILSIPPTLQGYPVRAHERGLPVTLPEGSGDLPLAAIPNRQTGDYVSLPHVAEQLVNRLREQYDRGIATGQPLTVDAWIAHLSPEIKQKIRDGGFSLMAILAMMGAGQLPYPPQMEGLQKARPELEQQ